MKLQKRISQWSDTYVARRIAMDVLGMTKEEIVTSCELPVASDMQEHMDGMAKEYFDDWKPLAYVLGYELFCGHRFSVDERVLIPRPETEELVTLVAESLKLEAESLLLIDMGTGSWCVGLSIVANGDKWWQMVTNNIQCVLCDVSEDALEVAKYNSATVVKQLWNSCENVTLKQVDVMRLSDDDQGLGDMMTEVDSVVIVANLPYIPTWYQGVEENVRRREPGLALYSWEDGLDHYRALIAWVQKVHREQKEQKKWNVWMEMMREQGEVMMKNYEGLWKTIDIYQTFHENIVIVHHRVEGV